MSPSKYKTYSTEELRQKRLQLKMAVKMFASALIIIAIVIIYMTITTGFTPLIVVPFILLPILVLNTKNLLEVIKEINLRN